MEDRMEYKEDKMVDKKSNQTETDPVDRSVKPKMITFLVMLLCIGVTEILSRNIGGNFQAFWSSASIYVWIGIGILALSFFFPVKKPD